MSGAPSEDRRRARQALPVVLAVGVIGLLVFVSRGSPTGVASGPPVAPAPEPADAVRVDDLAVAATEAPPAEAPTSADDPTDDAAGSGQLPGRSNTPSALVTGEPIRIGGPTSQIEGLLGTIGTIGSGRGSGGLGMRGSGLGGGGYGASGYGAGIGIGGSPRRNGAVLRDPEPERGVYYVPPSDDADLGERGQVTVYPDAPASFAAFVPERLGNTEHFTDYGVSDTFTTDRDRFSTFSIDVDTGSFTLSRRKLQSGTLPPVAAVRVEEFVNYFGYRYPTPDPQGSAPFAVHMEASPDPFAAGHHAVRIGVKGREIAQEDRAPVHLTFLVDVSGSMSSPDKLGLAQESLHYLVDGLGDEDSVAIATYAGRVERVLPPTWTTRRGRIHGAIDALSSGGSTAMSSGIDLAYELATEAYLQGHENRVIVLSDGDANVGPSTHEQILTQIERYAGKGITLSTIGFGMGNYQDTLMEQLADKGDGNYFYVDDFKEAKRIFGEGLMGTIQVIARDVKIQVEFNPQAVMAYRLVGYENRDIADEDFRNDAVDAGEIGSGHSVTAVYDVVLRDEPHPELATVRLRAKPPGEDAPAKEWLTTLQADRMRARFAWASPDFRMAWAVAHFAELLRGSPHVAELQYADVFEVVQAARRDGDADHTELLSLIAAAGRLSGQSGPWETASASPVESATTASRGPARRRPLLPSSRGR